MAIAAFTRTPELDSLAKSDGSGVVCAFRFCDGVAQPLGEGVLAAGPGWVWTHYRLGDVRAQAVLRQTVDLPAEAQALFRADETRVQIRQSEGWVFGVLPDLERDLAGGAQDAGRLVFALDAHRLVTARLHPLCAVDDLRRAVEGGLPIKTPRAALAELITFYLDRVEALLDELGDQLATVEDYVLTEPQDPRDTKLSRLRRTVTRHRRELQGLRTVLARAHGGRAGKRADLLADDLADVIAWVEDLDQEAVALQERGRLIHEEVDTLISGATNRSMRALTIISTLLIPPTLIVGAFGMNLSGIPFGHDGAGFAWATGLCLGVVGLALWMLHRMNLLR